MKVGSISSQMVRPMQPSQSVQTQNQNVNNQDDNQKSQNNAASVTSEKFNSHHSKCSMSTEDFLSLHNSGVEQMVDGIKDIMALKVLEKTLEAINKIVSDWPMEIGDLVTDKTMPGSQGIIVEVKSTRNKSSKTTYVTYLVHWFDTGFKSTHGPSQLALIS